MKQQVVDKMVCTEIMWDDVPDHGIITARKGGKIGSLTYELNEGFYWRPLNPSLSMGIHTPFRDGEVREDYSIDFVGVIKRKIEEGFIIHRFDNYSELYRDIADYCEKQEAQDT